MRTLLIVFVVLATIVVWKEGLAEEPAQLDPFSPEAVEMDKLAAAKKYEPPPADPITARSLSRNLPQKGLWRGKPVLVDLTGDGHLDLVASIRRWDKQTPGEGVYVWIGDGQGGWTEALQGLRRDLGYGGAEVQDIDGDGHPDLAFSCHDYQPHIFLNFLHEQDGAWVSTTENGLETGSICADVALGDFNRDGHMDLAALGQMPRKGGLFMFYGVGDGSGAMQDRDEFLTNHFYGAQVEMRDIDGDGNLELLAATALGPLVWRWDEEEGKAEYGPGLPTAELGGADLSIDSMDLDGDGHHELLVAGLKYGEEHPALQLFKWTGEVWTRWGGKGLPADDVEIAYFDAEFVRLTQGGPISIVAAGQSGVDIYQMGEPGTFTQLGRVEGTDGAYHTTTGDVNGDGKKEVVFVGFGGVKVLDIDLGVPSKPAPAEPR